MQGYLPNRVHAVSRHRLMQNTLVVSFVCMHVPCPPPNCLFPFFPSLYSDQVRKEDRKVSSRTEGKRDRGKAVSRRSRRRLGSYFSETEPIPDYPCAADGSSLPMPSSSSSIITGRCRFVSFLLVCCQMCPVSCRGKGAAARGWLVLAVGRINLSSCVVREEPGRMWVGKQEQPRVPIGSLLRC
ncbi:hypothetical protein N658DRAFT_147212 [Parathielavia hyrcaniae]|uniref:Uncharacterized protein n=1 Tax=Parathielavia hyrcaniae TaxID=113614 RepID=A0AAN6Q2P4_9PEZI|nr:hypothetical protein N658DRAFT_147212 [Parathielavia hyrcaniae]